MAFISQRMKGFLETAMQIPILEMRIVRVPVYQVIQFLINISTAGTLARRLKDSQHDDLFHLFLVCKLADGLVLRVERNERFSITEYSPTANEESLIVPLNKRVTFGALINNTQKYLGSWNRLLHYDPVTSNCQSFVYHILYANGLMNDTYIEFR